MADPLFVQNHVVIQKHNCPNGQQSQGSMKFAKQISSLTLFKFDFIQEIVEKFQYRSNLGRLAGTPIWPKWPALWGPKCNELGFFSYNRPPFHLDFVQEIIKKFPN